MREHKFQQSFQDTSNPLCCCGRDIESVEHFLLHYPQFVNEKLTLLRTIGNINYRLIENANSVLTQTLLFRNTSFNIFSGTKILNAITNFILLTKRFDEPLFLNKISLIFLYVSYGNYFSLFCLDHNFFRILDRFYFFSSRHH